MTLWRELKRRKVFQVAAVYGVTAWLLVQIATAVETPLNLPPWFDTAVIVLIALGFPVTLILSWAFDVTSEGLTRDRGTAASPSRGGWRIERVLFGLLIVAVATLFYREFRSSAETLVRADAVPAATPPSVGTSRDVVRLSLELLPDQYLSGGIPDYLQRVSRLAFAFSPDGRYLVYAATTGEGSALYRRAMDEQRATPIAGTDGASLPFISPDSLSIGFRDGAELKRIPSQGGEARTIATADSVPGDLIPFSGDWTEDDMILVSATEGIYELPANGGDFEQLTQIERSQGESAHGFPQKLPGMPALLYNILTSDVPSEWLIAVQRLDGTERKIVIEGGSHPRYVGSGHIVFARSGALWAVPFDLGRLEPTGAPVVVIEDVMHAEGAPNSSLLTGTAQFSVSDTGSLAYASGGTYPVPLNSLHWVDRNGRAEPLPLEQAQYMWPRVSPDGRQLVYAVFEGFGHGELWRYDIGSGIPMRLTSAGRDHHPVWSPDGEQVAFSRGSEETASLFVVAADGSEPAHGIADSVGEPGAAYASTWSPNDVLAYVHYPGVVRTVESTEVWTVPIDGNRGAERFVDAPAVFPDFSPDGKWLAYVSIRAGRPEVYVRAFPEGSVHRVTADGGNIPLWSPDGRELFYWRFEPARLMVVEVETDPVLELGEPRLLFEFPEFFILVPVRSYDITPDGTRFIMGRRVEGEPQPVTHINIVLNWLDELRERVPAASMPQNGGRAAPGVNRSLRN